MTIDGKGNKNSEFQSNSYKELLLCITGTFWVYVGSLIVFIIFSDALFTGITAIIVKSLFWIVCIVVIYCIRD